MCDKQEDYINQKTMGDKNPNNHFDDNDTNNKDFFSDTIDVEEDICFVRGGSTE